MREEDCVCDYFFAISISEPVLSDGVPVVGFVCLIS